MAAILLSVRSPKRRLSVVEQFYDSHRLCLQWKLAMRRRSTGVIKRSVWCIASVEDFVEEATSKEIRVNRR
jgi:hypothetical protein